MRISDWSSDECSSDLINAVHCAVESGLTTMSCVTGRKEARLDRPSMTGGGAALKARGYPPIFFENRLPPRPLRDAALRSAALTSAPLSVDRKSTRLNSSH